MWSVKTEPKIKVGIMDRQNEVAGHLDGNFVRDGLVPLSGGFLAKTDTRTIVLYDETYHEICRSPSIRFTPAKEVSPSLGRTKIFKRGAEKPISGQAFSLFNVTIGNSFHWEMKEDQAYQGDLILKSREDGTISAINEISLEDYLKSVISSEMSAEAPIEFLKVHAILSRSWLLAGLTREKTEEASAEKTVQKEEEVIRWYDREDHDLFDVCADDHCQRYQGITKIVSEQVEEAIGETNGRVITYQDEICDARYSKACGGITENFETAWGDKSVPYLRSISDAATTHRPIGTEEEASAWIFSKPDAYCNIEDARFLQGILPDFDRETKDFFRWRVEYAREELEEILKIRAGFDFGTLKEIVAVSRGPSGRISRLRIVGSKRSMMVGKELEIRRWLSNTHLYSSAFVVKHEGDRFIFHGAGWGHGVGLCQIGAAVMAGKGFSAEEILKHYFSGVEIKKIY